MNKENGLKRFIDAQQTSYQTALNEIKNGKKRSHWMWYIFPQIQGLGLSETARYYAIRNKAEAVEFLNHPVLGSRLIEISNELLKLKSNDAYEVLGSPDNLKLKSCMTLFSALPETNPIFHSVLKKFFDGAKDDRTMQILGKTF